MEGGGRGKGREVGCWFIFGRKFGMIIYIFEWCGHLYSKFYGNDMELSKFSDGYCELFAKVFTGP